MESMVWGIHNLRLSFLDFIRFLLLLPMRKSHIWRTEFKVFGSSTYSEKETRELLNGINYFPWAELWTPSQASEKRY